MKTTNPINPTFSQKNKKIIIPKTQKTTPKIFTNKYKKKINNILTKINSKMNIFGIFLNQNRNLILITNKNTNTKKILKYKNEIFEEIIKINEYIQKPTKIKSQNFIIIHRIEV